MRNVFAVFVDLVLLVDGLGIYGHHAPACRRQENDRGPTRAAFADPLVVNGRHVVAGILVAHSSISAKDLPLGAYSSSMRRAGHSMPVMSCFASKFESE